MNWEAVSAICDTIGAAAVFASLVYVGYQVRQNTQAIHSSEHRALVDQMMRNEGTVLDSEDVANLVLLGESDPASLTPEQRLRFQKYIQFEFVNWETAFLSLEKGLIDRRVWETWDESFHPDGGSSEYFRFWRAHRNWFDPTFVRHVEQVYAKAGFDS